MNCPISLGSTESTNFSCFGRPAGGVARATWCRSRDGLNVSTVEAMDANGVLASLEAERPQVFSQLLLLHIYVRLIRRGLPCDIGRSSVDCRILSTAVGFVGWNHEDQACRHRVGRLGACPDSATSGPRVRVGVKITLRIPSKCLIARVWTSKRPTKARFRRSSYGCTPGLCSRCSPHSGG